jgi:hypothetical protein
VWTVHRAERLPGEARRWIVDGANTPVFSSASIQDLLYRRAQALTLS